MLFLIRFLPSWNHPRCSYCIIGLHRISLIALFHVLCSLLQYLYCIIRCSVFYVPPTLQTRSGLLLIIVLLFPLSHSSILRPSVYVYIVSVPFTYSSFSLLVFLSFHLFVLLCALSYQRLSEILGSTLDTAVFRCLESCDLTTTYWYLLILSTRGRKKDQHECRHWMCWVPVWVEGNC